MPKICLTANHALLLLGLALNVAGLLSWLNAPHWWGYTICLLPLAGVVAGMFYNCWLTKHEDRENARKVYCPCCGRPRDPFANTRKIPVANKHL